VQTALRIADTEGLEAVSIRRIARELRSGAMSLYHYFDSRDELLDLMGDTVAAEMLVPGKMPTDWREALRAIAHHSHGAFTNHPWLLSTLRERPRVSPNLLRHIEQSAQSVAALAEAGVHGDLLAGIVTAVDDYTIGYTLRELHTGSVGARFADEYEQPHVRYLLESGEFPLLAQFVAAGGQPPRWHSFEEGLEWLLDGFAARLAREP